MAEPGKIVVRREGAVGWVVLDNQARRNAVSVSMWQGLADALRGFRDDPAIRAVVLTGAGDKAFAAGADISEFESRRSTEDAIAEYNRIATDANSTLKTFPKPTIAMIRGFCFGGGVGLALGCDLRVAADDAVFSVPAARLGLAYPMGSVKALFDAVGAAHAKEILFTARRYGAAEALQIGLVGRVVPVAELEPAVGETTAMIADNAPLTVTASKLAVDAMAAAPGGSLAAAEAAATTALGSEDYKEGRRAFMEKRRPVFTGH